MPEQTTSNQAAEPKRPPGAHWYLVAVVLMVMGPIALYWSLSRGAEAIASSVIRFASADSASVRITQPGAYSLWRILDEDDEPFIEETFVATIIEPTRGAHFELEPIAGVIEGVGDSRRFEIARTSIRERGPYIIEVAGAGATSSFEFGPSSGPGPAGGGLAVSRMASNLGAGALTLSALLFGSLSVIGFLIGAVILVVVWVARDRVASPHAAPADQSQD